MKNYRNLARFQSLEGGPARHGVLTGDHVIDLTASHPTWTSLLQAATHSASEEEFETGPKLLLEAVRLLAPVDETCRVFGVALNYRSHVEEVKREVPEAPIIFMVPDTAMIGPNDEVMGLESCQFLDYEAELAVVIGSMASKIPQEDAYTVVAGITLFNDVTGRDLMFPNPAKRGIPDWLSAKGLDRSTPIGPHVYRPNPIADIEDCEFYMDVNGQRLQQGRSEDRVFSIPYLISFLSNRLTLRPGDVIATGTPTGTGNGRGVPLVAGDQLVVSSPQIGTLANRVAGNHQVTT